MDIGDPSEIPTTRKRLPSMQELGAFEEAAPRPERVRRSNGRADDLAVVTHRPDAAPASTSVEAGALASSALAAAGASAETAIPAAAPAPEHDGPGPAMAAASTEAASSAAPLMAPAPAAAEPPSAAPSASAPAGTPPRPVLTPEQLRLAISKADPATRRKLLSLFAGGQSVQQTTRGQLEDGSHRLSLVMQRGRRPASPDDPTPRDAAAGRPAGRPARPSSSSSSSSSPVGRRPRAEGTGETLLQIDANTDLLDAATPETTPSERRAGLQDQVDAALQRDAPRADSNAPKVLFPAYDPEQHGGDVRGAAKRRKAAPVEGHFPAPRQPFQATYRHPDGRQMTDEENKVEEVLQTQRCDETLSVLAREGVNGLLLSPRDLDAAVAQGVLSCETAVGLWKTWAALRPVIHVIEDDPAGAEPAPSLGDGTPIDGSANDETQGEALEDDGKHGEGIRPLEAPAAQRPADPVPDAAEAKPTESPRLPPPSAADLSAPDHEHEPTLPLGARFDAEATAPANFRQRAPGRANNDAGAPPRHEDAPLSTPRLRLLALLRWIGYGFVAYCVATTSARLALWAWLRWGHLWPTS